MSTIVKIVEVIAESEKSFDDATQQAVREVAKSVRGIKASGSTTSAAPSTATGSPSTE